MSGPDSPLNPPPRPRLPGRWLGAIPLLWLVGLTLWVLARWPHLPRMIPVHWGLTGFPDYWVRRTPSAVAMVIGTMGAICVAFVALAWLLLRQPPQMDSPQATAAEKTLRRQMALLIVTCAWFVAFQPAFALLPLPYGSFRIWMVLFAASLMTGITILIRAGLRLRRARAGETAAPGGASGDTSGVWRGPFHFDRSNRALFVPKRFGTGYTLNFGNPWAWLIVAVPLAALLLTFILKR